MTQQLNEKADKILLSNGKIAYWADEDARCFAINIKDNTAIVSSAGKSHSKLYKEYNISISDKHNYHFEGRLWLDKKIISFWEYPSRERLEEVITEIEKEIFENEGIKENILTSPQWFIEVNFQGEKEIIPLTQYTGSSKVQRKEHEKSPLLKTKRKTHHSFGSEKLGYRQKLVGESIEDILKSKNIIGKLYYSESSFVSYPVFVFKIIRVKKTKVLKDNFHCEVIFNAHMIEGPSYYEVDPGKKCFIDEEDFKWSGFKELDSWSPKEIDSKIKDLQEKKEYFMKLKNES